MADIGKFNQIADSNIGKSNGIPSANIGKINAIPLVTSTLKTNLIACLELDETSGTNILDSYSTNHGTITNALNNQAGKIGKCLYFDGSSDYGRITQNATLNALNAYTNSYSVSAWVKDADPTPINAAIRIMEKRLSGTGVYPFSWQVVWNASNALRLAAYDGSNTPYPTIAGAAIWDNAWHHVVMVVDQATDKIIAYLDGAWYAEVTNSCVTNTNNSGDIVLGANGAYGTSWYRGNIDQVAIWGKALTTTEITSLWNSGNGLAYSSW